ncbi:glutamate-cysteine ligase modifier subunit [Mytilinidion resinicola]|uniref:GCS light chain n=1 Tax=Mytilinidion resinicola TaxID=574789 RepID=A0A6A6Z712_9PEZI|nr:glutamate-cysteine ligase modifier subunit [Mytilinidion resinicola]KAF2816846.1 glutamate-cysteine ligase modifier subunit [Mytilinidion resinicola]
MKLILSTSNIMGGPPSVVRRPGYEKSNTELTSSLRSNFTSHQQASETSTPAGASSPPKPAAYQSWTSQHSNTLFIPASEPTPAGLAEERSQYDITVKLFYLPNIPSSRRSLQNREAIDLVLRELGVSSIDLLIVSFPGISFDADDEDSDYDSPDPSDSRSMSTNAGCPDAETAPEDIDTITQTWRTLEKLHEEGIIAKLGVAEFGTQRLARFLPQTKVRPAVDQINVRDCCVVPKPLILYAKQEGIELLTHNDCTNVLPRGTLRELLGSGEHGAGVLAAPGGAEEAGLRGDVEPQWVVKYTAVVKNRGVVESKGYFAAAELRGE